MAVSAASVLADFWGSFGGWRLKPNLKREKFVALFWVRTGGKRWVFWGWNWWKREKRLWYFLCGKHLFWEPVVKWDCWLHPIFLFWAALVEKGTKLFWSGYLFHQQFQGRPVIYSRLDLVPKEHRHPTKDPPKNCCMFFSRKKEIHFFWVLLRINLRSFFKVQRSWCFVRFCLPEFFCQQVCGAVI